MGKYTKKDIMRIVADEDVEFIRMQFTDIFGQLKNVAITASQLEKALNNQIMIDGSSIEGFTRIHESDQYLYPDPDSFTILPWATGTGRTARLICDVYNPDGTPFIGDPRGVLKRALKKAADMGYTFNVGPECEFFLFETDEHGRPTTKTGDEAGYFDLGPVDHGEFVRRDICLALEAMGFEIEASHHEVAHGQHEIDFKYADALTAALPNCTISLPQEIYSVTLGGSSYAADSTYVDATSQGVTSLDGVEHFTGLQVLILDRNPGIDLSNAGALTTVTSLGLANCGLTDISALSTLTQLTSLDLMLNDLRDISALRYLTGLTELHLSMNEDLSDISALASLEELTTLSLNGTAVTDLSALENLTNLTVLDLEGCNIRDITPLLGLKNLRTLYAAGCGLSQQEIDELGDALPNCTIYT